MISWSFARLALLFVACPLASGCGQIERAPANPQQVDLPLTVKTNAILRDQEAASSLGLVPYWNDLPENPIHEPRAVYLDIYWRDLQPKANTQLTREWVLAVIEKRLKRPLSASPKVAIRFKATGDASAGPLPSWFKPAWKAPKKCNTEKGQELPAWNDSAQLNSHAELVKALALALDGHPQIAWIEPGSYGFWGEGHLDGAPQACVPSIKTRENLIRPWIESFHRTPLSVTMDWFRRKDDPDHRLRDLWSTAGSIGLRFDCLGFWQDEYATVIQDMAAANLSGWNGPWGGEFCFAEDGAQWAMGSDNIASDELRKHAPPEVATMTGDARRTRVLAVVRACGWSYIAGAGASLLKKEIGGNSAQLLESAMVASSRDLAKCAMAARVGNP